MHNERIARGTVKPGQQDSLAADSEIAQAVAHARFEYQPCRRRTLICLIRSLRRRDERRFNSPMGWML